MNGPLSFAASVLRAEWRTDRWSALRCRAVWDETHDVRTFLLAPDDGARILFEPGQFMTFRTVIGGKLVERCYTLSSSAATDGTVAITVKRQPGGLMSEYLHATLAPGGTIEAFGPSGNFGTGDAPEAKLLLLSGGSGVTPMAAILRSAADLGDDLDAVFLHAARTPSDVIYSDEFASLRRRLPRLRVVIAASRAASGWTGERGRIDGAMFARVVPDLAERSVLCCGPVGFMTAMRAAVIASGVPAANYSEESFNFGDQEETAVPSEIAPSHRITFTRTGRSFDCAGGATILQAARAAGIPIASSCGRGICGTCKSLMLSGAVTMNHGGGIRQREVDRGLILPCSSRPETDIVLDR